MKAEIVVGLQWGDEGKGKIVDVLSKDAYAVIRYQGGANAGHTIVAGGKVFILHLIPSGILRKKISFIGNGVVVDIEEIIKELDFLEENGIDTSVLKISSRSHLLLPIHRAVDAASEQMRGKGNIGTTGSGIGPAYSDKARRRGLRCGDMTDRKSFEKSLKKYIDDFNENEAPVFKMKAVNSAFEVKRIMKIRDRVVKYVVDDEETARKILSRGRKILFEGAQGTMLDIDFGTYPYVTSSHPVSLYAFAGSGIPPFFDFSVTGVAKAYVTRVGSGPFPTRMEESFGDFMRRKGGEYGATTGRPRDCGWLDLFALNYACFINRVDSLALTKIDMMADNDKVKVCVAYRVKGKIASSYPSSCSELEEAEPVYIEMNGWTSADVSKMRRGSMPQSIGSYIKLIEEYTEKKISMVSTGPDRKDICYLK